MHSFTLQVHILFLNYSYHGGLDTPDDLLQHYHVLRNSCDAVRKSGASQVTVVQRFKESGQYDREGIRYIFVNDGLGPALKWWKDPHIMHELASRLFPDVVHIAGVAYFAKSLRLALGPATPILWQNRSPGHPRLRAKWLWKRSFRCIDGVLFTSGAQGRDWREKGIIGPNSVIYEIVGGSTHFAPLPYDESRSKLGMSQQMVFLWVGRLDSNKDPLTVLSGFRELCSAYDNAHLYMIYGTEELLGHVKDLIRKMSLGQKVHLLGLVAYENMPLYFSAADFFVLGSHQEECGFAAIEALACGATPLVTDIPSFRVMTNAGRVGFLWQAGSSRSFARAAVEAQGARLSRTEIRKHFSDHLSYEAMGKRAMQIYSQAIAIARSRSPKA